jgi:hypothetical protein
LKLLLLSPLKFSLANIATPSDQYICFTIAMS